MTQVHELEAFLDWGWADCTGPSLCICFTISVDDHGHGTWGALGHDWRVGQGLYTAFTWTNLTWLCVFHLPLAGRVKMVKRHPSITGDPHPAYLD